jgi:hypothetical protein
MVGEPQNPASQAPSICPHVCWNTFSDFRLRVSVSKDFVVFISMCDCHMPEKTSRSNSKEPRELDQDSDLHARSLTTTTRAERIELELNSSQTRVKLELNSSRTQPNSAELASSASEKCRTREFAEFATVYKSHHVVLSFLTPVHKNKETTSTASALRD